MAIVEAPAETHIGFTKCTEEPFLKSAYTPTIHKMRYQTLNQSLTINTESIASSLVRVLLLFRVHVVPPVWRRTDRPRC
jgi:hypothetical protein